MASVAVSSFRPRRPVHGLSASRNDGGAGGTLRAPERSAVSRGPAPALGAIFDWDGVIVDSSAHHELAWERLAAEVGRELTTGYFERGFGLKNERIIPDILGWSCDPAEIRRLSSRKEELYRIALRERGISLLPGAAAFLGALRANGVPCAVGSSSHRKNIEAALAVLELDFDALVTAEDVSSGKPDPEVFLLAAERIGVAPSRCVVFEDVPAGIEAALRGGMRVVAVTTSHPAATLSKADRVVDRLDRLSPATLESLLDEASPREPGHLERT